MNLNTVIVHDVTCHTISMSASCWDAGSRCWSREEPGIDGVHISGISAFTDTGVLGGMEHGEPGGDLPYGHCWVMSLCGGIY